MRRAIFCVVIVSFVGGCGQKPPTKLYGDPFFPNEVQLPKATGAEPLDKGDAIYLNVTESGRVLLAPSEQFKDADGMQVRTLDEARFVFVLLSRLAKEYFEPGGQGKDRPAIVLRVDARTPFEKTSGVLLAAIQSGYRKFRWHAVQTNGEEGQIEFVGPIDHRHLNENEWELTARVTSEQSKVAKIVLRGHGIDAAGIDVGSDFELLLKQLKEIRQRADRSNGSVELALEIDHRLLQDDVIRLLDAAAAAGIKCAVPTRLRPNTDPKG